MDQVTLRQAVDAAGGPSSVARGFGVSVQAVYQWLAGERPFPDGRVLRLSELGRWQVSPHTLNPDLYPNPTDGLPPEMREEAA